MLIAIRRFLLARLHLESLADKTTIKAVKRALKELPRGEGALNHAYEETLRRIEGQGPSFASLARNTLMWLVCAKRELTIQELRYALAIEEDSSELDEENLEDADEIISASKGLVTLDRKTEVVRLVHYTTWEFLERILPRWNSSAEEMITKACLQYLSFWSIRSSLNCNDKPLRLGALEPENYITAQYQEHVLLRYALVHVMSHAQSCWNEAIEDLVQRWLWDEHTLASYLEVFLSRFTRLCLSDYSRTNNTALHISVIFACETLTAKLLSASTVDVNVTNSHGETPLHKAVQYGRDAIATLLLDRGEIQINIQDNNGATPIVSTARTGHEDVAMRLLKRGDLNIHLQDNMHHTALFGAAMRGLEALSRLLLQRADVPINQQDKLGLTPLMWAASEGHEAIVGLLLQKDEVLVNLPNAKCSGPTALMYSAGTGQKAIRIVEMLLKREDIQVNLQDECFGTALSQAAENGHCAVVKLLLQRDDVDVNLQNEWDFKTALTLAVKNGHEVIVGLLLQRYDIQVNLQDRQRMTALLLAAREGNEGISRLLLRTDGLCVNLQDRNGMTALTYAAFQGHETTARLLLQKDDIDVNVRCNSDGIRLMFIRALGIDTKKVIKPDLRIKGCWSALMFAAAFGNIGIVRALLDEEDIQTDCRDVEDRTALILAYEYGYEDIVNILERAGASGEIPSANKRSYPTGSEDVSQP